VITEISSYWNTKFNLFPGLVYNFEQHWKLKIELL
jgi:hypothetical protein